MKIHPRFLLAALLLTVSTAQAAGPAQHLLPASSTDQVPAQLHANSKALAGASTLDRTASAMSWAIDPAVPLDARPKPFVQQSREYWVDASADELRGGLKLAISAKGALIRLSPHAGTSGVIYASTLNIRASGRLFAGPDATSAVADQDALRAAGMDVPEGSVVVKLADSIGSGAIELFAPTASGAYLVHVFEPASPIVLTLASERDSVLAGESLQVRANVEGGAALDRLSGLLSAPDGYSQRFDFQRQGDGSFLGTVVPAASHAGGFGLWEVHAFGNASSGNLSVPRDARTAVAINIATARFDGRIDRLAQSGKGAGLTVRVGIEVAAASRYQLAGVVYATGANGSRVPAAVAHSAAWLEAGSGTIDLKVDAAALSAAGVQAPYELRDLRLINQADMSLLERRERAANAL